MTAKTATTPEVESARTAPGLAAVPGGILIAAALLGLQGVVGVVTGLAVLSSPARLLGPVSGAGALTVGKLVLGVATLAVVTTAGLVARRGWAQTSGIVLAAMSIAANLVVAGTTPWRAVVLLALPLAVIVLLVAADDAFESSTNAPSRTTTSD